MSSEQIIELSVRETNELRDKLGLAPLRGVKCDNGNEEEVVPVDDQHADQRDKPERKEGEEVLELSVDETNSLRERLGLAPLRTKTSHNNHHTGGASVQHVPAVNLAETRAAQERIERARLQRLVQQGMEENFAKESLASTSSSTNIKSWAQQMRQKQQEKSDTDGQMINEKTKQQPKQQSSSYSSEDVAGLSVAHRLTDLEHGSTTLTLADSSILQTDTHNKVVGLNDEDEQLLENVNLVETQKQKDGLKQKRQIELGAGRAGGYAGFDDDEFEELGGTQAPSRSTRGLLQTSSSAKDAEDAISKKKKKRQGFRIGTALSSMIEEEDHSSDLFAAHKGKAISLEPSQADVIASDFLTAEEIRKVSKKESKKKEPKFKKKKKEKKSKSKKRQSPPPSDDEEEVQLSTMRLRDSKGLLQELEETAVDKMDGAAGARKRRRLNEEETDETTTLHNNGSGMAVDKSSEGDNKRAKFEAIMAKGNERTMQAFQVSHKSAVVPKVDLDDEPDDAFLNAALSKARRLNRLKELSGAAASSRPSTTTSAADTIAQAVKSTQHLLQHPEAVSSSGTGAAGGTIDFSVDETREFTRALQARTEQQERLTRKARNAEPKATTVVSSSSTNVPRVKVEDALDDDDDDDDGDTDMTELAKEVKDDAPPPSALDGATGGTVQLGRGLGGVLGLLQQTGEFTRKHAGKEELRGRAKDERHYDDYEALDLKKVVRIDERTATDKDKELAKRQIKLEYRDKHGRLLTRKEAFRDLSYQFHGYGCGKRKEEKKMVQIAREQAEARQSQTVGTLSALQATQKASGKAYVVHKT